MTTKSRNIILVSFLAFLALIISLSFVFSEEISQQKTVTPQITGGYLFNFDIKCVDSDGNVLKTVSQTGNGTAWSFAPPEIEGYTTTCESITRNDISNWFYPPSHYDRKASGSLTVVYTPSK